MITGLDKKSAPNLIRIRDVVENGRSLISEMFNKVRSGTPFNTSNAYLIVDQVIKALDNDISVLACINYLKEKNEYTYMHSLSVCTLMIGLSRAMRLDQSNERVIGLGGLLIDIGKMAIESNILNKPGVLTNDEMIKMRKHPEAGYFFLMECEDVDDIVLDICLHHHERMDGSGYPHALRGDKISIYSRMAAICDAYDAITSNKVYAQAKDPSIAIGIMNEMKGQFDPNLLFSFIQCVGIYPVGSLVRLKSERLAVVVQQNNIPNKPVVKIIFSISSNLMTVPVTVSLHAATDEIVGIENPDDWKLCDVRHFIEGYS